MTDDMRAAARAMYVLHRHTEPGNATLDAMLAFASTIEAQARADEREQCAAIADNWDGDPEWTSTDIAAAIRSITGGVTDSDAATGSADDALPGSVDDWRRSITGSTSHE